MISHITFVTDYRNIPGRSILQTARQNRAVYEINQPNIFNSQSVTNLVSVWFCSLKDNQVRHLFTKAMIFTNRCKMVLHLAHFHTTLSFSHFKYFLEIFADPFSTYNVLLQFNFKCFISFPFYDFLIDVL